MKTKQQWQKAITPDQFFRLLIKIPVGGTICACDVGSTTRAFKKLSEKQYIDETAGRAYTPEQLLVEMYRISLQGT